MTVQRRALAAAIGAIVVLAFVIADANVTRVKPILFFIGILMGVALYHAAFGFTSAYRRAIVERDISGIAAQCIMVVLAMVLFAPSLAEGQIFGRAISGAVAPVSVSMALGALVFGIGMQLAGGCGSGSLMTSGAGNGRMMIALVFFCIGGFWGSLDLAWWQTLPGIGSIELGHEWGWTPAILAQMALVAAVYLGLRAWGGRNKRPIFSEGPLTWQRILYGPWPLIWSAVILAVLNWATLAIANHPWSVTWAFALWTAKASVVLGWDPATSGFWADGFPARALARSVFQDTTSVMNFGIMLGAMTAASLRGRMAAEPITLQWRSLLSAIIGGLMLGYGARLAYGCNIGAFFSGVASTSLHGWVWILFAVCGNIIGVRLRPWFRLSNA